MNQLAKKSLPEKVMECLESEIVTGKYAIGDKIPPEPELVAHFKVSRNSVREAVQSLIHAGILEARQGSGTYVVATSRLQVEIEKLWNQCDFEEIDEFRVLLGKFLIKSASKKINNHDAKALEEKVGQLKDCLKSTIQASKIHSENSIDEEHADSIQNFDDSNSEFILTKNVKKNKKKNISLSVEKMVNQENSNAVLADTALLKSLDDEYTLALIKGAHNKVIMSLFRCLQKEYIVHVVKDNKEIWANNIKIYGQIAAAVKNKNAKTGWATLNKTENIRSCIIDKR